MTPDPAKDPMNKTFEHCQVDMEAMKYDPVKFTIHHLDPRYKTFFEERKRFREEKTFLGFSSKHIFKQVDTFRVSKNKVTAAASRQLKWFENEIDTNVSFDISL